MPDFVVDILKLATMFTAGGGSEHMAGRGSHVSKIFNVLNCIAAILRTFDSVYFTYVKMQSFAYCL